MADFVARFDDAVHLARPHRNVASTLQRPIEAGHVLGICTNKSLRPCKAVLSHLNPDRVFRTVWGGDSLPVHKPDPSPLRAASDAFPEGPEIYAGDSDVDAETAGRADVPFLLVTEGYRLLPVQEMPHAAAFSDFADLPALVETLQSDSA